jgi:hypothetical protein
MENEEIRLRAYYLWLADGSRSDDSLKFWFLAEKEQLIPKAMFKLI